MYNRRPLTKKEDNSTTSTDVEQQLDNNQIRLLQNQSMKATFEEIVQMASRTG